MKFFLVTLVLIVFLRLPSFFEPHWYLDENLYLSLGQGINQGLHLYSQLFDHKPPSIYFLSSLFSSLLVAKVFLFFIVSLTVFFFYRLASKLILPLPAKISTIIFSILLSLPKFEGNIFNAEIINLLPVILAFLLYFQKKSIILSALLFGLAFTFKTPSIFDFFLFLFLIKPKFVPKALIGFLAPISLWAAYFAINHQFLFFINSAFFSNYNYLSSWSTHFLLSQIFLGLITIFLLRRRPLPFLPLWFLFTLLASTLSSRPYPHYLIQVAPALCLLLGSKFSNILLVLFSYLIIVLPINFYHYPTLNYYLSFYRSDFTSYFGPNIPSISQTATFISENSNPNDFLYVWGNYPQIYYLSHTLPSSRYLTAFHVDQFQDYQYILDQLKINQPRFIILAPDPPLFPQLNQFVSRYYYLKKNIDNFLIYQQL